MRRIGSVVLLALVFTGCSKFKIRSASDPNADFSRLHTWAWLPLSDAEPADQRVLDRLIDARIRSDVAKELASKGYSEVAGVQPDFLLNYRVGREVGSENARVSRGGYGSAVGWWGGWGTSSWETSYDEGTLFLGVINAQTRQSMWVGAAETRLVRTLSDDRVRKKIDDAVHQILENFPPKSR